jgi:hypothetical protein
VASNGLVPFFALLIRFFPKSFFCKIYFLPDQYDQGDQGPTLLFFKYFRRKILRKMAFFAQNKAKLCKNLIITLVYEKNAIFFAEKWQKSQKIVIITSTPGANPTTSEYTTKMSALIGL